MSSTITAVADVATLATCYIPILSGLIQIGSVDPGVLPKPQNTCATTGPLCVRLPLNPGADLVQPFRETPRDRVFTCQYG
jgi:hypothetical protein